MSCLQLSFDAVCACACRASCPADHRTCVSRRMLFQFSSCCNLCFADAPLHGGSKIRLKRASSESESSADPHNSTALATDASRPTAAGHESFANETSQLSEQVGGKKKISAINANASDSGEKRPVTSHEMNSSVGRASSDPGDSAVSVSEIHNTPGQSAPHDSSDMNKHGQAASLINSSTSGALPKSETEKQHGVDGSKNKSKGSVKVDEGDPDEETSDQDQTDEMIPPTDSSDFATQQPDVSSSKASLDEASSSSPLLGSATTTTLGSRNSSLSDAPSSTETTEQPHAGVEHGKNTIDDRDRNHTTLGLFLAA